MPIENDPAFLRSGKMLFTQKRTLGKTGLRVGPLGLAAGYGAPTRAIEEAFEKGCNYFYWGSMRKPGMAEAIRNICGQGKRDEIVLVLQSYSRSACLMQAFVEKGLRSLGLDHAEILVLGWRDKIPAQKLLDKAIQIKEKGLVRFLGISGHNRKLFPELAKLGIFDLFQVRYNAAHRGAEKEIFALLPPENKPGIVTYTATRWGKLLDPKLTPAGEKTPSASDCYRFVLGHPAVDVCVCGPKNEAQMKEALRTLELGPLNAEEIARMIRIGDHVRAHTIFFEKK
jgi:aryl-alcohol dehydrogenase-like predicted oxidoreductase